MCHFGGSRAHSAGVFERTFVLPSSVDPDRIEARFENGVLVVRIPKAERARPREIRVSKSASSSQVRTASQSQRVGGGQGSQEAGNGQEAGAEVSQGSQRTSGKSTQGSGSKAQR